MPHPLLPQGRGSTDSPFSFLHLGSFSAGSSQQLSYKHYCSNLCLSWLEPTVLNKYHFFSLFPFCSKIPLLPTTTLTPLALGYSVTSVLPNPMIDITSHLIRPLSSISPSWYEHLLLPCRVMFFICLSRNNSVLAFLHHHWSFLFSWILLFPWHLSVRVSQGGMDGLLSFKSTLLSVLHL